MKKLFSILLPVVLFIACSAFAQVEPKILYEEDPTNLITHFQVVILTGSADDPLDKVGATNMLAELMLRGTKKRTRSIFQKEIERMGAVLSVHTGQDMIVFDGKVIRENTLPFLKLLEDCLLHPVFPKKEFEALKTELLAETAHIKNANNRLGGLTARKTLFAGTALERPVNGSLSTIKMIKMEDLLRAYNNHFHQANFLFGVASAIKEDELKRPLKALWLAFPDGVRLARRSITPKVPKTPTLIVIDKPKTSTGSMLFVQAGIVAQDPLRYTLNTGNFSFGSEPLVSRLFRTIRGELGWTYAIGSTYGAMGNLSNQQGIYIISSTPSVEFTAKTLFKTLEMWKEYMDQGLKSDEVKLAEESTVNSYPFEFDLAEKRLGQRIQSFIYGVPILNQEEHEKKIYGIDNDAIKKALGERHQKDAWLITLVADKDVVTKQLEEAQKDLPVERRLKISKVITPDDVIE